VEPLLEELLGRAFREARPEEANAAIARAREELGGEGRDALSYEAVIPEGKGLAHLAEAVLPRLVYYLDCRGVRLPDASGVFVTLFAGKSLYFIAPADFFDVLVRATGLSCEQMVSRWGAQSV